MKNFSAENKAMILDFLEKSEIGSIGDKDDFSLYTWMEWYISEENLDSNQKKVLEEFIEWIYSQKRIKIEDLISKYFDFN